jgi:hypothetical protein
MNSQGQGLSKPASDKKQETTHFSFETTSLQTILATLDSHFTNIHEHNSRVEQLLARLIDAFQKKKCSKSQND